MPPLNSVKAPPPLKSMSEHKRNMCVRWTWTPPCAWVVGYSTGKVLLSSAERAPYRVESGADLAANLAGYSGGGAVLVDLRLTHFKLETRPVSIHFNT